MADNRENELVFRPLHESPIVSVHDYCCHIARGGPGVEEESDANNIVLSRFASSRDLATAVYSGVIANSYNVWNRRSRTHLNLCGPMLPRCNLWLTCLSQLSFNVAAHERQNEKAPAPTTRAINDGGIKVTVAGKEITVCCDECAEKAKENPAQYAGVE